MAPSLRIGSHMGSHPLPQQYVIQDQAFRVGTIQRGIMAVFRPARLPLWVPLTARSLRLQACASEPAHGLCPELPPSCLLAQSKASKYFLTFNSDSFIATHLRLELAQQYVLEQTFRERSIIGTNQKEKNLRVIILCEPNTRHKIGGWEEAVFL